MTVKIGRLQRSRLKNERHIKEQRKEKSEEIKSKTEFEAKLLQKKKKLKM